MEVITVTAKTENGTIALKKDWKEYKKQPIRERMIIRATGYLFESVDGEPYQLKLTVTNKHIEDPDFLSMCLKRIREPLAEKNAFDMIDYDIVVEHKD